MTGAQPLTAAGPWATALDAALGYAGRGWPVCPWVQCSDRKFPLTPHGHLDATVDLATIRDWSVRWPSALIAIATGERSGVVALDIDIRPDGSGFDSLEYDLGVAVHPETPTSHSPRGGCHLLFAWPGRFVKTVAGALAPHLDIRGDGGSLILPPAPGRFWDPHLNLDTTPIAAMPAWMMIAEPEHPATSRPVEPADGLSHYARAALDSACRNIATAPAGEQEQTLVAEAFSIGTLAGADAIPAEFARRALVYAGAQMTSHDPRRRWVASEIAAKVERSFRNGINQPRARCNG